MRILLIANTLPPVDVSGVGEQVLQLASGLRAVGHEVEVLGRGRAGAKGPKLLFPLTVLVPTARLLSRFRPHVVQVHESDGALAALLVAIVAPLLTPRPLLLALLQVSYLEELRAVRPLRWRGTTLGRPGIRERLFKWIKAPLQIVLGCLTARLADRVMAPSRRTASEVERDYRVSAVAVVPNLTGGVRVEADASGLPPVPAEYLLFIGRLRIRKGVEVLLEALSVADRCPPDARLVVAGDGEHRTHLESRTLELGLTDRVEFLGRCSAAQVRALLEGSRALVVPSIYEGMPLVVLEAMESSRAVIASAVSGIPEVVIDGHGGWLVPVADVDALADAIAAAWSDPGEAERRGQRGFERLEEAYRPAVGARRWLSVVEPMRAKVGAG